ASSLQRYRTAENLRLGWENNGSGGPRLQRQHSQLFSWEDDFWKAGNSRRSPQSVASSASTFEEVESLCFSRSSSDSFNSSWRPWENRYGAGAGVGWGGAGPNSRPMWGGGPGGGGGAGGYPGRPPGNSMVGVASKRQRMSRQSSTTSTSTSRSSAGGQGAGAAGRGGGDDDFRDSQSRRASQDSYARSGDTQSITGKLLESMEFLGSSGNLDLADKLYLEKIFHRALTQNCPTPNNDYQQQQQQQQHQRQQQQQQQQQQPALRSALKKPQNNAQQDMLSGNEVLLERLQRLKHNRLIQRESGSAPASATSSPVFTAKKDNLEKKRRKDLILPDEEEPTASSKRHQWTPASERGERFLGRRGFNHDRFGPYGSVRPQNSDSYSKSSMISSMSSISMENGSLRASPVGSISPASPNNLSEQHPNLATFLSVNQPMQRVSSMDSVMNGAPPDGQFNVFSQPFTPSHAERVLMGLGFGAAEGFLPERFLKDWYNKISRAQSETSSLVGNCPSEPRGISKTDSRDTDFSAASFYANKTAEQDGLVSSFQPHGVNTANNDKVSFRSQPVLQRHDSHVSSISSVLDEAASYLPKGGDRSSRNERIGDYVAAHSSTTQNLPAGGAINSRAMKMRQFASDRQKSLPLHLETLTEEDELRIRKSGLDPFDKEARLQMFISDTMSSSGRSTNSEQSRCGSNQSESDSLSSCSELIDARVNSEIPEWQQSQTFRKQQDQIPKQFQQVGRQPAKKSVGSMEEKKSSKSRKHQSSPKNQNKKDKSPKRDLKNKPNEKVDLISVEDKKDLQVKAMDLKPANSHDISVADQIKSEDISSENQDNNKKPIGQNESTSFTESLQNNATSNDSKKAAKNHEESHARSPRRSQPVNQSVSITSGESLEVADIMQNQMFAFGRGSRTDGVHQGKHRGRRGTGSKHQAKGSNSPPSTPSDDNEQAPSQRNPLLKSIEPAMVSIILEDVDSDENKRSLDLGMMPQEGNHLHIPSSRCSSSSSLSPIPQSPVTVIEVGQLDNQQDSLDTEGTGSSRETDDEVCSSENSTKSRSGRKSKRSKHGHRQMLSPPTLKALHHRRNSENLVPQLSVNDEPLDSRRLSLDVPTVARLQRISEQRLQELNENLSKQEDEEESISPVDLGKRRGSSRRASFCEDKPVIINDVLANRELFTSASPKRRKSYGMQGSDESTETSSHRKKGRSRERRAFRGENNEDQANGCNNNIQNHNVIQYESQKASRTDISPKNQNSNDTNNLREQNEQSSNEIVLEGLSHAIRPHLHLSPSEKQSPLSQFKLYHSPKSIDSSPGSVRSAFTSTGRTGMRASLSMPGASDYHSETDVDEFPSTVKLTLQQRPISSFTKNIAPGANPFRRNSSSSSLISLKGNGFNPNVLFSSSPKRDVSNLSDSVQEGKSAVHTISRAVQASGGQVNNANGQPFTAHSMPQAQTFYFVAKDQETQCNMGPIDASSSHRFVGELNTDVCPHCNHIHQRLLPAEHVHVYNKFTQTGVLCYEVSCQTDLSSDIKTRMPHNTRPSQLNNCASNSTIRHEVNNLASSIEHKPNIDSNWQDDLKMGNYHASFPNDHHVPTGYVNKTRLNFNVIDETIELIEAELFEINTKRRRESNAKSKQFQRNGKQNKVVTLGSNENQPEPEPFQFRNVIKNDAEEKRTAERYAPSTWADATSLLLFNGWPHNWAHSVSQQSTLESQCVDVLKNKTRSFDEDNRITGFDSCEKPRNQTQYSKAENNETLFENRVEQKTDRRTTNALCQHLRSPLSNLQNTAIFETINGNTDSAVINVGNPESEISTPTSNLFRRGLMAKRARSNTTENDANSNKSNSEKSYPTVDSKDLIVKMYELQQDLTTYLKPCEGMYGDKDGKTVLHSDTLESEMAFEASEDGKENTEPLQYDFSIENANTTSGYGHLFCTNSKTTRRFSTPAVYDAAHWSRTHSKLARLKYQNNSHQNSFNSLDIEVDFMNAGEPLGSCIKEKNKISNLPFSFDSFGSFLSGDRKLVSYENSLEKKVDAKPKDDGSSEIETNKKFPCSFEAEDISQPQLDGESTTLGKSPEIRIPCEEKHDEMDLSIRSGNFHSNGVNGASNPIQFLSPRESIGSSDGQTPGEASTPEIVISPIESAHAAFLTVPFSPQHLFMKATFPSVSSSPSGHSSPSRSQGFVETNEANSDPLSVKNSNLDSPQISTKVSGNRLPEETKTSRLYMVRGSTTSSILDSSTFGSLTDLSNIESLDRQSMSDVSKISMYPHLSKDSATDITEASGLHSVLDDFSDDDIGNLGSKPDFLGNKALRLRRDLSLLGKRAVKMKVGHAGSEDLNSVSAAEAGKDGLRCGLGAISVTDDDVDVGDDENDSIASLAGSDNCKDVDDMEILIHQSRFVRRNSSSTYSEPDLGPIDDLSDDESLASSLSDAPHTDPTGRFLTISGLSTQYSDDLLQVSDYGGHSPSP
ncbi:hypothetical protein EGW08_020080, partial [Elysia chlorotica]